MTWWQPVEFEHGWIKPAFQPANATTLISIKPRKLPLLIKFLSFKVLFQPFRKSALTEGIIGIALCCLVFPANPLTINKFYQKRNQQNFLHFNRSILHHEHVAGHGWFCQRSGQFSGSSIWFDWSWHFLPQWLYLLEHHNGHPIIDQLRTSKSHHKRCNRQIQFTSLHSSFSFNCWLVWLLSRTTNQSLVTYVVLIFSSKCWGQSSWSRSGLLSRA